MHLIKLDATPSTNDYLKHLAVAQELTDFTVVMANAQLNGKGQMGATWHSEPGKNLTFSVLKKFNTLKAEDGFLVNICISLAILKCLDRYSLPDLRIKWPNDIMSGTHKICGILIENSFQGDVLKSAVIGVGLNVNQTHFDVLYHASSLKKIMGKTYVLDELLAEIVSLAKHYFLFLETLQTNGLWSAYKEALFKKDKPSTFEDSNKLRFMGFIRGVSEQGKLIVELEDNGLRHFDLKQVRLLYPKG